MTYAIINRFCTAFDTCKFIYFKIKNAHNNKKKSFDETKKLYEENNQKKYEYARA